MYGKFIYISFWFALVWSVVSLFECIIWLVLATAKKRKNYISLRLHIRVASLKCKKKQTILVTRFDSTWLYVDFFLCFFLYWVKVIFCAWMFSSHITHISILNYDLRTHLDSFCLHFNCNWQLCSFSLLILILLISTLVHRLLVFSVWNVRHLKCSQYCQWDLRSCCFRYFASIHARAREQTLHFILLFSIYGRIKESQPNIAHTY